MNNFKNLFFLFLLMICFRAQAQNAYQQRQERTEWFRQARFGMFIHWGVYAIPARGEWVQTHEKIDAKLYKEAYVDQFNPTKYDPAEWARLAKQAGMKYAVITAKHHDGFCLFDSEYTDYKATNTPAGRDLIREFVEAFRNEGIRIGFYYSLIDWNHPDYPNVGNHPKAGDPEWKIEYNWDNYLTYMHNQVEELVTNYGKIDIMWFDYSFGDYKGEKWKASELVEMVRKHQPGIIIDNRLGGEMTLEKPEVYAGDFEGPEQVIPYDVVRDEKGRPIPWEACITLNNNWGYSRGGHYKTAGDVVRTLVNCVSKNGNLLLNVGPDARGNIPAESVEVLQEVGAWMRLNQESIYGCGPADLPKPQWGYYTQNGNTLYAHVLQKNIGQYYLRHLADKIQFARLLRDGSEVFVSGFWLGGEKPFVEEEDAFMNFGRPIQHTYPLPDSLNTVVKIQLR
ncbi:MAG: alpha-L-fucosidase [Candidatus Cyclobacteriaceae bacterium M3_2C_046]